MESSDVLWIYDVGSPDSYAKYQGLLFVRSVAVLAVVVLVDFIVKRNPQIMQTVFRSLKVSTHDVLAFAVVAHSANPAENLRGGLDVVMSGYKWVLRIGLVTVVCSFWDAQILNSTYLDLGHWQDWNKLSLQCLQGSSCYSLYRMDSNRASGLEFSSFPDFIRSSFIWDLRECCRDALELMRDATQSGIQEWVSLGPRGRSVICYRQGQFDFSPWLSSLGVMFATMLLIVWVYEALVYVMVRHPRLRFKLAVDVLIVVLLCLWVFLMVWETVFAIASWISRLTFLGLPLVLINVRRVSAKLQECQAYRDTKKAERVQQNELEIELESIMRGAGETSPSSRIKQRTRKLYPAALLARFQQRSRNNT